MKTKREILKLHAQGKNCKGIPCEKCPFWNKNAPSGEKCLITNERLARIGAMAILRQNRKKREFDPDKILTCVTADKAKVGMRGYFADNISTLKQFFENNNVYELKRVLDEDTLYRFESSNYIAYALFYPIDEVEE